MCKTRFWLGKHLPLLTQRFQGLFKGKLSKGDNDAHFREQFHFADEKRQAGLSFFGKRPVVRRRAADSRADVSVDEVQPIFAVG
jgi:hypothetical protein